MTSAVAVAASGNNYIDGLLSGAKWSGNVTFSMPTDMAFILAEAPSYPEAVHASAAPLTAAQMTAVREIMVMYNSFLGITITEITESSTVHADIRLAQSNVVDPTAASYFPSNTYLGGDCWFGKTNGYYTNPVRGSYAYQTFMHEIGHALGLKHGHQSGGPAGVPVPSDKDAVEYSNMTYRSYVGSGTTSYTVANGSYPVTAMSLDMQALQYMYGANYSTRSTNTSYTWSPTTGEWSIDAVGQGAPVANKVLLCVWDGGGTDTYDFTNYSPNFPAPVVLTPGSSTITSTTQRGDMGNGQSAAGCIYNAYRYSGNTASDIENSITGVGVGKVSLLNLKR